MDRLTIQSGPVSSAICKSRKGQWFGNVWTDIRPLSHASKEKTGYPTQKPLALLERIIKGR